MEERIDRLVSPVNGYGVRTHAVMQYVHEILADCRDEIRSAMKFTGPVEPDDAAANE